MSDNIHSQYDFFQAVQLDAEGNLLVSIVNFTGGTSGGTVTGDYLPLSGGTITGDLNLESSLYISGLTFQTLYGGNVVNDQTIIADAGGASTIAYEINIDGGLVGGGAEAVGHHPYKVDLLSSGNYYSFSGEVNVLSVKNLTSDTSIVLPSYPKDGFYVVKDKSGNAGLYKITVSVEGGGTIDGETEYIININTKPSITFLYDSDGYIVI